MADSDLTPGRLGDTTLPLLSTTKLGSLQTGRTHYEKKLAAQRFIHQFTYLKAWQRKILLASIIERCAGNDLHQLNNILEPVSHRGFIASFNQSYPVDGLLLHTSPQKLQNRVARLLDKMYTAQFDLNKVSRNTRNLIRRRAYLSSRATPTPMTYPDSSMRDFSRAVQNAVHKLLDQQNIAIATSDEAKTEVFGITPRANRSDLRARAARMATKTIKWTDHLHAQSPDPDRGSTVTIPLTYRPAAINPLVCTPSNAPPHTPPHTRPDTLHTLTHTPTHVPTRMANTTAYQSGQGRLEQVVASGMDGDRQELTPDITEQTADVTAMPFTDQRQTLRASSQTGADNSQRVLCNDTVPAVPSSSAPYTKQPIISKDSLHEPNHTHPSPDVRLPQQQQNEFHKRISSGVVSSQSASVHLTVEDSSHSSYSTEGALCLQHDERGKLLPTSCHAGRHRSEPAMDAMMTNDSKQLKVQHKHSDPHHGQEGVNDLCFDQSETEITSGDALATLMEDVATSELMFECVSEQHIVRERVLGPKHSDIVDVVNAELEYRPSSEELFEDNQVVREFSSHVYAEIKKSATEILDEDDLAEQVAACILSSSAGVGVLASSNKMRYLNLRDRLSNQAVLATLKVFRVKPVCSPDSQCNKIDENTIATGSKIVPPFSPRSEPTIASLDDVCKRASRNHRKRHTNTCKPWSPRNSKSSSPKVSRCSPHSKKSKTGHCKYKGLTHERNVPLEQSLFDKESKLPSLRNMQPKQYCRRPFKGYTIGKPEKNVEDFKSLLTRTHKELESWTSKELVQLLVKIISHTQSVTDSVLPTIRQLVLLNTRKVTNITELPDRLINRIFSYLDAKSLEACQSVCRRWKFFSSRPEIWRRKCSSLGRHLNLTDLVTSLDQELNDREIDWQLAYHELEGIQHQLNISEGDGDVANTRKKKRKHKPEKKGFTPIPDTVMSQQKSARVTRFPALRISCSRLVNADKKTLKTRKDVSRSEFDIPTLESEIRSNMSVMLNSWSNSAALELKSEPLDKPKPILKAHDREDPERPKPSGEELKLSESMGKMALDVRTDLIPANQMFTKTEKSSNYRMMKKGDLQDKFIKNIDIQKKVLNIEPKAAITPGSQSTSTPPQKLLQWVPLESFDPKDYLMKKRFVGVVKPVTWVHKFKGHSDAIYSCAFDRNRIFTGGKETVVYLWDIRSGSLVQELHGHTGSVRSLVLDSEANILYSASWDKSIVVWDVQRCRIKACLLGHVGVVEDIKLCKERCLLLSGSYDGSFRVWSTLTYSCRQVLQRHSSNITCLALDGGIAATGSLDTTVCLYEMARGTKDFTFYGLYETANTLKDVRSIAEIALSSGQRWDMETKTKYMANSITSVKVINDLVLAGTCHGELYCWSKTTTLVVSVFDLHIGAITSLNLWCQRLLTASRDGTIREWDVKTMTCVRSLHDHTEAVNCVQSDDTLERIVSVGEDKLVHIWHFKNRTAKRKSLKVAKSTLSSEYVTKPNYVYENSSTTR